MIGQRFGRLTVIAEGKRKDKRFRTLLCKCDCGEETTVARSSLVRSLTKSCGCIFKENLVKRNTTHSQSKHPAYTIWYGMKTRCYSEKHPSYKWYGEQGIKVCKEWDNDFIKFKDWYENNLPKKGTSLERIDSSKDYSPQNCKWATPKEQSNNRKNNILITINNETLTLSQWAEKTGIKYNTAYARYTRGLTIEKILER